MPSAMFRQGPFLPPSHPGTDLHCAGVSSAPRPHAHRALCSVASSGAGPPARTLPLSIGLRCGQEVNINPVAKQSCLGNPQLAPSFFRGKAARALAGACSRDAQAAGWVRFYNKNPGCSMGSVFFVVQKQSSEWTGGGGRREVIEKP